MEEMEDSDLGDIRMGLVVHGGRLLYGWDHGWFMFLPQWAQRPVVLVWNWIACKLLGHDKYLDDLADLTGARVCTYCCKSFD